jgi:integrase
VAIVADYIAMLKGELGFGPDDPLFPSTQIGRGSDRGFVAEGLSRTPWSGAAPIRQIFRASFAMAGLPYANPHSFRKTLALHGDSLNLTREEEKAYSQNFGHESVWTTRESYGTLPAHRQARIMRSLSMPRQESLPGGLDIAALEAFVQSAKRAGHPSA